VHVTGPVIVAEQDRPHGREGRADAAPAWLWSNAERADADLAQQGHNLDALEA
jgi:hypothetical protein